jgi:hypothetical protein
LSPCMLSKNVNIAELVRNCKFAYCFVWMWKLISQ